MENYFLLITMSSKDRPISEPFNSRTVQYQDRPFLNSIRTQSLVSEIGIADGHICNDVIGGRIVNLKCFASRDELTIDISLFNKKFTTSLFYSFNTVWLRGT